MEFGKYRLVRKLATGGMAEIFLARQEGMEGFEKTLVIKRILPIHADNDELIDMFLDEARIAATLTHTNIVQIFDLGRCDEEYFIAMEFVHGQDLRRICERGLAVSNFLPLRHAVRIIADAAAGLYFAHNQADKNGDPLNIVHRDISPQNLVVSFDGVVKILDFGIAKAANKIVTTRHGQLKGKYAYMSPEQCNGLDVDHRSDIFSLGTLLYEITVCTRLFKGDSDVQTIRRVSEAVVPRPSEVRPNYPMDLEAIVLKALAKDPEDRYSSGLAFQTDLEDFLANNRMKTGPVQLGNYLREVFPDKLQLPQPDPDLASKEARRPGRRSPEAEPATEGQAAEGQAAEGQAAEGQAAEGQAAEGQAAEGQAAEGQVTEAQVPETQVPGVQAPEAQVSETQVPETQVPEANETDASAQTGSDPEPPHTETATTTEEFEEDSAEPQQPTPDLPTEPPPSTLQIPELQERPPLDDPSRVAPVGVETDPDSKDKPVEADSHGHVSYVVSPNTPFTTGPVTQFKKKAQRRVARSAVKSVEHEIRSDDDVDNFERGSRIYYFLLSMVVIPMLGFGVYLLYTKGTFCSPSDIVSHTSTKFDPDVAAEPLPPPLETVLLDLSTDPPNAMVVVNGVLQDGETPGNFNVVPGTCVEVTCVDDADCEEGQSCQGRVNTVSLYAAGYVPRHKNEDVPATGTPDPLHLNLSPVRSDGETDEIETNSLEVTSVPTGAAVYVNGRNAGVTPLKVVVTSETEHHVTVRMVDHFDHVAILYAWPGDTLRINAALLPTARETAARFTELRIQSRDAEIWIDREVVGRSTHFRNHPRNQTARLELRRKGFQPYRRVLATTVGSISVEPALTKIVTEPGQLTLRVTPRDTQIFVGSTEYEPKQLRKLTLPAGKYKVTLVKLGEKQVRGEVEIEVVPREVSSYEIDFSFDEPELRRNK